MTNHSPGPVIREVSPPLALTREEKMKDAEGVTNIVDSAGAVWSGSDLSVQNI